MSMSKAPSKYLKCPTCHKTPNYDRIENILSDAMAYRDNRPYNPHDPVIVSESEIFCCSDCYVIAVIREEEQ
jgi:hypothetical protein